MGSGATPAALRELAMLYKRKGGTLGALGRFKEADAALTAGVAAAQALTAGDPKDDANRFMLATLYGNHSVVQMSMDRFDAGYRSLGLAVELLEDIVRRDPRNVTAAGTLASHYSISGEHLLQRDPGKANAQRAFEAFDKGRRILELLHASEANNAVVTSQLAIAFDNMGWALQRLGEPQQAAQQHRAALAIWNDLVAKDPANTRFRDEQGRSFSNLGQALLDLRQVGDSIAPLQSAVAVFEQLPAGAREESYTAYSQGVALYRLGRALEARAQQGGAHAAARDADRRQAGERYRTSLAILREVHQRVGTDAANLHPDQVASALQRIERGR